MSCFVRIATRLTDELALKEAVSQVGYQVVEGRSDVRGYSGTERADVVIDTGGAYDIGAVRTKEGAFELVADWEMARVDRTAFVGKLTQAYGVARVTQAAKKSGFVVAKQKVDERGSVKLTLRRFV